MLTLPNILSLFRIPLACLFFQDNPWYRAVAIIIAMLTDLLDGFLARKYKQTSTLGTILDPFTDKLFVFVALMIYLQENRLEIWQAVAFLSRDFSVLCFSIYLGIRGELGKYRCGAIWCGKIATAIQFPTLVALALDFKVPVWPYIAMIFFGLLAFGELYLEGRRQRAQLEQS